MADRIEEALDDLFTNGSNEKADRLVLMRDKPVQRDLGGRNRDSVAAILAALVRREVEREREACAELVEDADVHHIPGYASVDDGHKTLLRAAAAIRARNGGGE